MIMILVIVSIFYILVHAVINRFLIRQLWEMDIARNLTETHFDNIYIIYFRVIWLEYNSDLCFIFYNLIIGMILYNIAGNKSPPPNLTALTHKVSLL